MPSFVAIVVFGRPASDSWMLWAILGGMVVYSLVRGAAMLWPHLVRWWSDKRARGWPTVSGVIDIAVVTKEMHSAGRSGVFYDYPALLTYSYRNPDLQTGDYNRTFATEWDAQDWVDSCKGRTVTVHVNPRDPTCSVLRTEELESAIARHS
jgi:hypothetical protein